MVTRPSVLGHNVGAALLLPQTQQNVKHLLRQGLEFFSCHVHHLLYSIIDNSEFDGIIEYR